MRSDADIAKTFKKYRRTMELLGHPPEQTPDADNARPMSAPERDPAERFILQDDEGRPDLAYDSGPIYEGDLPDYVLKALAASARAHPNAVVTGPTPGQRPSAT